MKGFLMKIISIIAKICIAIGAFMTIIGVFSTCVGMENDAACLTPGVTILVIASIVYIITSKSVDKNKIANLSNCKKCGASLSGCRCEWYYRLSEAIRNSNDQYDGSAKLLVNITAICPNCGKKTKIQEFVNVDVFKSPNEQRQTVEYQIQQYIDKYFG